MRVPTFFAHEDDSDWIVDGPFGYFIAIIFGAVHLAGWNFLFQSPVERDIWRVASIIITASAAAAFIANTADLIEKYYIKNSLFFSILNKSISALASLSLIIYLPARLILLAEALLLLKDLPPGALDAVGWTLFIPHV